MLGRTEQGLLLMAARQLRIAGKTQGSVDGQTDRTTSWRPSLPSLPGGA